MPVGKYENGHPLADLLPLEGAFVSGFFMTLSPAAVKVYVFLNYLCAHPERKADTAADLARAVALTEADVITALEALDRKHLIRYVPRPFGFEVLSAAAAEKNEALYNTSSLTAYSDYFTGIRSLFPGRSISGAEYDKARDWIELYGLSVECALMLISHCIESKDAAISFSYMDKVALSWANDGIVTAEKAEDYLTTYQAKNHEAARLLRHLGLKRLPTVDEMRLYQQWTEEYGFELPAIKEACREMTKIYEPNFAYLDKILQKLHAAGVHSEKAVRAYLSQNGAERGLIAALLSELGERNRTVTPYHLERLHDYALLPAETLIRFAQITCEQGFHTFTRFNEKVTLLLAQEDKSEDAFRRLFEKTDKPQQSGQKSTNDFTGRSEGYGDRLYTDIDATEV